MRRIIPLALVPVLMPLALAACASPTTSAPSGQGNTIVSQDCGFFYTCIDSGGFADCY